MTRETSINLMHASPRCTAKSKRSGQPCRSPAVNGYRVCRMHGAGGGAPKGKRNGRYRTGLFTAEMIEAKQSIRMLRSLARDVLDRHK